MPYNQNFKRLEVIILTDEELVKKSVNGDELAFEELVFKYEKLIYSVCYRMFNNKEDAMDCTQDTFIKIYKNMEKSIGKGSFKSWICTIATNTCLDELRKRSKKSTVSIDAHYDNDTSNVKIDIPDLDPTPLDKVLMTESADVLKTAIDSLSDEDKAIIVLRDIEGLSYDDIAKSLDISLGTVKSRLSRTRKKLQKKYLDLLQQYNV